MFLWQYLLDAFILLILVSKIGSLEADDWMNALICSAVLTVTGTLIIAQYGKDMGVWVVVPWAAAGIPILKYWLKQEWRASAIVMVAWVALIIGWRLALSAATAA